jgi:hypothetical protein
MNKTLLLTSASAFALILAASTPAFADDGARAKSESTVEGNFAIDDGSKRKNSILGSWNGGATGIVHDQQNNGANNGIGAATAVHADVTGGTALDTSAKADSTSQDNTSDHEGDHGTDRENRIERSMRGFVGSATLQQNNGDNNAINAATALDGVDGDADGVRQQADAKASARDHGGDWKEDLALDDNSNRRNEIEGDDDPSFDGAKGVFTVQQNNGSGNGISAATAVLGVTGNSGELTQDAKATARAKDNGSINFDTDRFNNIQESFISGFAGVATVQQNNGDGNGISAATAVAGVGGDAGGITQHAIAGDIGAGTRGNDSIDHWGDRVNRVVFGFVGAEGVMTVQQNNGDNNAMGAATAVAGALGGSGDIHQGTGMSLLFSGAAGNDAVDIESLRENLITSQSFTTAKGVVTVQQNNGDANDMGAATAVTGVTGNSGNIDQHAVNGLFLTGSGWNGLEGDLRVRASVRDNLITNAMQALTGVAAVQQNNGNANHMGAATGLIGVGGTSGDVDQKIIAGTGWSGSAFNNTDAQDDDRDNRIQGAIPAFEGILTVQQNNGDVNNMVAMNAVTATSGAGKIDQNVSANNVSLDNDVKADNSARDNLLSAAVESSEGVATVQQNNGDANSIVAMTGVVAVAGDSGKSKQKINAWGASKSNNTADEGKSNRNNEIDLSFDVAKGVVTAQQNNGSANVMTAATGVVANTGGAADTKQKVRAGGEVIGNDTFDKKNYRTNTIDNWAFSDLRGIATVQQNNGDGNVMSASTAVAANTGDGKLDDVRQKVKTKGLVTRARAKDIDNMNDGDGHRSNTIDEHAFDNSQGIVTVQQNNGDNNVIAAATGVRAETQSTITSSPGEDDVSRQLASTKGTVKKSTARAIEKDPRRPGRENTAHDAFLQGVDGVFTVQQNNGDNNVIGSSVAVAANINSADDLDSAMNNDARTRGTSKRNKARDLETRRNNSIHGNLFGDASGIMTVQQNNGSNNVMGSAVGVVANVNTGFRFGNAVTADATGKAIVKKNDATVEGVSRRNGSYDASFNGAQGVMTLQQNNGDNNVMGSAVNVVATTELPGFGPAASTASLSATVSGNTVTVDDEVSGSSFENIVENSFNGAAGLMTVQQNNGNNNGMGSAITTVANGITFSFNPAP